MDKYNFNKLKNIKVPEKWIENALDVPNNEPPKRTFAPVRFYRFAAGIATCVVIAAAVTLSLMFGINKNIDMTDPEPNTPSRLDLIDNVTSPTSTPDVGTTSKTPPLLSGESDQSGTAVTEPAESDESAEYNTNQQNKKQDKKQNNKSQAQNQTKPDGGSEKSTEPMTIAPENTEPVFTDPAEDTKPVRPTNPVVYGCHFLTTVEISEAEGKTYYCKIKDESGDVLGSGAAQKYDWGNPDWPLDLRYTADYELQYGNNYNVTFYDSEGENVWDGTVYLQQNKSSYLLYNE